MKSPGVKNQNTYIRYIKTSIIVVFSPLFTMCQQNIDSELTKAFMAYHHKDFDSALSIYESYSEHLDAFQMQLVSRMYHDGSQTIPKNYLKALEWIEKSAMKGDVFSMTQTGILYFSGSRNPLVLENFEKSYNWFLKASEKGNEMAIYYLGLHHQWGRFIEKNTEKAKENYYLVIKGKDNKAKNQAMFRLSQIFRLEGDEEKAKYWLVTAAESGNGRSFEQLATSEGISPEERINLLKRACEIDNDPITCATYMIAKEDYETKMKKDK